MVDPVIAYRVARLCRNACVVSTTVTELATVVVPKALAAQKAVDFPRNAIPHRHSLVVEV